MELEQNKEQNEKIKKLAHKYFVTNCENENAINQYYDNVNKNISKKINATSCIYNINKQFCKYDFFMLSIFIIFTTCIYIFDEIILLNL